MDKMDPQNEQSPKKLQIKMIILDTRIDLMAKQYKEGLVEKSQLEMILKEKQRLLSVLSSK